jgi:copper chaperone CopZ
MPLKSATLLLFGATLVAGAGVRDLRQPSPAYAWTAVGLPPDTLIQVTLHVEGMTCAGCTIATRKVLARLPGVTRAEVSYERKEAVVTYDPAKVTVAQMIAAVKTLEYTATVAANPAATPTKS